MLKNIVKLSIKPFYKTMKIDLLESNDHTGSTPSITSVIMSVVV